MKHFLYTIFSTFILILIVFSLYAVWDPYKVIHHYKNYYATNQFVELNSGCVATRTFLNNKDSIDYNSFIFGSSRTYVWTDSLLKPYMNVNDRLFHYGSNSESLLGITKKIEFISKRSQLKNVILLFDSPLLSNISKGKKPPFLDDPIIYKDDYSFMFHYANFISSIKPRFLLSFIDYKLFHKERQIMPFNFNKINYNPNSNEYYPYVDLDRMMEKGEYYVGKRLNVFFTRNNDQQYYPSVLNEKSTCYLRTIKQIFENHNTEYYIIINPLYDQKRISTTDLDVLCSVFGKSHVYDYSGINQYTNDYHNYYETSHYKQNVVKSILESIYN